MITDGSDRNQRFMAALEDGYFLMDEMRFEDLLAVGKEIAANLRFYNTDFRPDGTWETLFSRDEVVIMAIILNQNLKFKEARFHHYNRGKLYYLVRYIFDQYLEFDSWYQTLALSQHPSAINLKLQLYELIEKQLREQLHELEKLTRRDSIKTDRSALQFDVFSEIWKIDQTQEISELEDSDQTLRLVFASYLNAVIYLKSYISSSIETTLHSQEHDPALGLFMTFLMLFKKIQQQANRFTQRHLDFYYSEFLKAAPRAAVPNTTNLIFAKEPGTPGPVWIKPGTPFTLGKDEDLNDIVYITEEGLAITDAKVEQLMTLYFHRDHLMSPENELNYITQVYSDVWQPSHAQQGMPLFGAKNDTTHYEANQYARLGFALASPLFDLREGERSIELMINLTDVLENQQHSGNDLTNTETEWKFDHFGMIFNHWLLGGESGLTDEDLKKVQQNMPAIRKLIALLIPKETESYKEQVDLAKLTDGDLRRREQVLHRFFRNIFQIQVTTESGWEEVEHYNIALVEKTKKSSPYSLKINIQFGSAFPAIHSINPEIHGDQWKDVRLPIMTLCLNPQSILFPYSLFAGLKVETIEIKTSVQGIKNLQVYNHQGPLDPFTPFQPFGPTPNTHSYFVVGAYEFARKTVTRAQINLNWSELPQTLDGFRSHYYGYPQDYDNACFQVSLSTLRNGTWEPDSTETSTQQPLFAAIPGTNQLKAETALPMQLKNSFKPIRPDLVEEDYVLNVKSQNGFVKWSLIAPQEAFGHGIYPALLTQNLMNNAKRKKSNFLPNAPYTPMINKISLDYEARSVIRLENSGTIQANKHIEDVWQERMFHLHPFGTEVLPAPEKQPFLFPQYLQEGNLFIGISSQKPSGRLSLFFHLVENSTQDTMTASTDESTDIQWFYLSLQGWKSFPETNVISDSTQGFLVSGTILLDIPEDIVFNHPMMPPDLYWLKVSASSNLSTFSHVHSVSPHALKVTHQQGKLSPSQANQRPEAIEWQSVTSIPGLARIQQKQLFFGGQPHEEKKQFQTRLMERLHHKNRASIPWDYERLVLENFSQIDKVKCFSNMKFGSLQEHPGHVLLVVLRRPPTCKHQPCGNTRVPAIDLRRIKNFLQKVASPFVQIDVRNPTYEEIQVRCQVQFITEQAEGFYRKQLERDLSDYFCPWTKNGYQGSFGWRIYKDDIESYLYSLDYIDFVTGVSLIHVTHTSDGPFCLSDTAQKPVEKKETICSESWFALRPRVPWSLATPNRHHLISVLKTPQSADAVVTGINDLEIGNTFIIQGGS